MEGEILAFSQQSFLYFRIFRPNYYLFNQVFIRFNVVSKLALRSQDQLLYVSKPCLPIQRRMYDACSVSVFFENGPEKISLQYCLNRANSSGKFGTSQFISGVRNPVATAILNQKTTYVPVCRYESEHFI